MLSQRVVAASCYLQGGIGSEASRETLLAAKAEFALIADAREIGHADLRIIGAEERRRTLVGINKLREFWQPMETRAKKFAEGAASIDDIVAMAAQSAEVLDVAIRLTAFIADQYATQTTILQTDGFAIDIAGRQHMLAQRISKNVCLNASGVNVDTARDELSNLAQSFEAALYALRDGSQQVGIRLPPNETNEEGLNTVIADWKLAKPMVEEISASSQISVDKLAAIFQLGNQLTGNMNKVVGIYADASKIGL